VLFYFYCCLLNIQEQICHAYSGRDHRSKRRKEGDNDIWLPLSAKHAALRRKSKDWLTRNQNNVSAWGDMSIRGLLFHIQEQICHAYSGRDHRSKRRKEGDNDIWLPLVWVSEWLLLYPNFVIFSAISCREHVNFQWDDDEVRLDTNSVSILSVFYLCLWPLHGVTFKVIIL
jgi:hypothetical protein